MSRISTLLLAASLFANVTWAAGQRLVTLSDPEGDDVGNGSLVYPTDAEIRRGDFDLRSLDVARDDHGFWFTAKFRNPIREKWWAPADSGDVTSQKGNRPLAFNFNLDLYVDTNHETGVGQVFTLPGRKVRIDPRFAWERAVILCPQPKTTRAQLLATLKKNFPGRPPGEAEASIDAAMFFATTTRIHENAISFFVPQSFFAESDGSDWSITALVTAASQTMADDNLGVMQVEKTPTAFALGSTSPNPQPPIIDMLLPTAELQVQLLSSAEPLTGVSWTLDAYQDADAGRYTHWFKARMSALRELLDQGLIDEQDYKSQRERILNEL